MRNSKFKLFLLLTPIALLHNFCNDKGKKPDETGRKDDPPVKYEFLYRFNDASVPPEYHRSYTIRVTASMVFLEVDSYGDILLKDSVSLSKTDYDRFVENLGTNRIKEVAEKDDTDACTGGTSESLTLFAGSPKQIKGYVDNCGGKTGGTLAGEVEEVIQLFKDIYPGLAKKVGSTNE